MSSSASVPSWTLDWELNFLIAKFLAAGPCQEASKVLIGELEKNDIIPQRTDWLGQSTSQDFQSLSAKYDHIKPEHLLQLVQKLLEKTKIDVPPGTVAPLQSLLSSETIYGSRKRELALTHPLRNAHTTPTAFRKTTALLRRETYGFPITHSIHDSDYFSRLKLQCSSLGHLTAVYCVLFDVTGRFIFTGADDHLVKIWSAVDGRLLTSLRGNSAEITDLAVNKENTLLASSSCDRYIRIWCLATGAPVATLTGHTSNVTSIFFCPMPRSRSKIRYLASTSTDGSVAFWAYLEEPGKQGEFQLKPTLYLERMRPGHAQMICSSFSPGGTFMAAGSADNNVRVYHMLEADGPKRVLEVEPHSERVDSISWAHRGVRFISGSKDGTALVWRHDFGDNWKFTRIYAWKSDPGAPPIVDPKLRPRVTMIGWNADDTLVLTAVSNHLVKVWNPETGHLVRILRDHTDEVFVIEPHPIYPRVVCTAGHDGNIFIWDIGTRTDPDINSGRKVFEYKNTLEEGQGHGAVFDVKWSPDGLTLAATDSHGHILIFSCAENEKFKRLPKELFFHTDYRPLTSDAITNTVLDEQTQVLPHLMPPPFLVNMDGAPYPAPLQRLVPGRENCREEQLIPNVAFAPGGQAEVIEGIPAPVAVGAHNARSNIDEMIAQLVAEQGVVNEQGQGGERRESIQPAERRGIAHRRSGDIEGVRQSRGNWQSGGLHGMRKRTIIPPLSPALLARSEEIRHEYGREEEGHYQDRKSRKLPQHSPMGGSNVSPLQVSPNDPSPNSSSATKEVKSRRLRRLAAQAAERRREEEQRRQNDEEGIPRPNPPQQEISLPQIIPRRNRNGSGGNANGSRNSRPQGPLAPPGTARRPRRSIRFVLRRDSEGEGEPPNSNSSQDSSFSSSDVSETSSSESEFTDSDWGGGGPGASPAKSSTSTPRKSNGPVPGTSDSARKRTTRQGGSGSSKENQNGSENSDEDYQDPRPGPSSQIKGIKQEPLKARPSRQQRKVVDESQLLDGISPQFRPSEWFGTQKPCRFPYWPQIGDELVYFRQGHEKYIKTIQMAGVYPLEKKTLKTLPWNTNPRLEAQISCRVISVKFEINPPRLVSLKLGVVDWESGEPTGSYINVTYHDMKDVVDFLILRQLYDKSMRHNWSVNDRFRCLIGNIWWLGTIKAIQPNPDFPNSKFLLYKVRWDNNDYEVLSPWDIEVIPDAFEIPEDSKENGIFATDEDIRAGLYEVTPRDWPPYGHQEAESDRISAAIGEVMTLGIAEAFLTPVDLNAYPDYTFSVAYAMDLATIKARLDNRFYRRIEAVKFDIKFIAINTETFNVSRSEIVKKSRIIRDLCLRICAQPDLDVNAEYHSLQRAFAWASTDIDEDERRKKGRQKANAAKMEAVPGTSTSARSSTRIKERADAKPKTRRRGRGGTVRDEESNRPWQERCHDLLTNLWDRRDSAPFREPVDPTVYPDYQQQIDTPMDLQSIKEDLLGGNYISPLQFSKDVQLIFLNSKQYNTDKHSQIHVMTLRLKSVFDNLIRPILEDWKRNKNRGGRSLRPTRNGGGGGSVSGTPIKTRPIRQVTRRMNGELMSPRKNPTRSAASRNPYVHKEGSSGDEEEEVEGPPMDSSSEEEFEADGDNYRDHRKKRKRKGGKQNTTTETVSVTQPSTSRGSVNSSRSANVLGRNLRGRTRGTSESQPPRIHEPTSEEEEEAAEEEEAEGVQTSSEEAEADEEHVSETESNHGRTRQERQRRSRDSQDQDYNGPRGSNSMVTTGAQNSTRTSTRRASLVLRQNGGIGSNVSLPTSSPRKNPKRTAAKRNPYVNNRGSSSHEEEEESPNEAASSEEEFEPAEEEVERRAGMKRRRVAMSVESHSSGISPPSQRRSRKVKMNGSYQGRRSSSPEPVVRRSSRIRPPKRRRILSDDDDGEEERGPNTRFRGRPSKNYEEGESNSSDDSEFS